MMDKSLSTQKLDFLDQLDTLNSLAKKTSITPIRSKIKGGLINDRVKRKTSNKIFHQPS